MHYEILISERELPIEESSEISDTKKLISMNNNQMKNNGEDICIDIQGRLHDKIINYFLFNLTKEHSEVHFCGSTEAILIHHRTSFRKMWKNEDLTKKSLVLILFNPTNSHWKLISTNLSEATVSVLDPMSRQRRRSPRL